MIKRRKGFIKKECSKCGVNKAAPRKRYCTPCSNAYMREWRKANPLDEQQKFRAHVRNKTKMRVKRGLLIPYPCEVCNAKKAEAHHDDYNKPYCVRWLCREHHLEFHKQERNQKSA